MHPIPTKEDFGIAGDLDVEYAWKIFGGKSLAEACQIFAANPFAHYEDLMWMDVPAFLFYFPIAPMYLTSDASKGDSDVVSCIAGLLEFRFNQDGYTAFQSLFDEIRTLCTYVVENYDKFEVMPDIYGDVQGRYKAIQQHINSAISAS